MESYEEINAILILEILGRPPEHIVKTLEDIIKKISEVNGVKLINKKIHEPTKSKIQENIYTTFSEVEIEVNELSVLMKLIFDFMPAHVEIIKPEKLKISNQDLNNLFNDLAIKLHGYEEIVRMVEMEKKILEDNIRNFLNEKKKKVNKK